MWRGFYYYYLYFCIFIIDISLLGKETAKIIFQGKFESIRATAKICSYKPQKIASPLNRSPKQFHATRHSVVNSIDALCSLAIEKDELTTS